MGLGGFRELVLKARNGDTNALGELLDNYRPYLRVLAQNQLDSALNARVDPSDVVQQTCLEIHRDFQAFNGSLEGELLAWVKSILSNNVANTFRRHVYVKKRSIDNERSLDDTADGGQPRRHAVATTRSTPSVLAIRKEDNKALQNALDQLPEEQVEAVRLRHLEGWSLQQLAEHFDRSEGAVAGLLKRGMQKLRQYMSNPDL